MSPLTCSAFKALITQFEGQPATCGPKDRVSYEDWCAHMHACEACADAVLRHRVDAWGIDTRLHPCIHMAYRANQTCPMHQERSECPDLVIGYDEVFDEYSIIKDGVSFAISHCPWCGVRLPPSQRDRWFSELDALLGTSPLSAPERVPHRYRTREWRG